MVEFLQQLTNGVVIGASYALIAVGLTMIFGMMHIVNFAHGEFYMLGGFMAFVFASQLRVNFFLSVVLAIAAVMIVGYLVERSVLRPMLGQSIESTMLATIGVSFFLQNMALIIWGPFPKTISAPFSQVPIKLGPIYLTESRLFAMAVAVVVILGAHYVLQRTKLGRAMRSTFQDRDAAALAGVNITQIYSMTFNLGAGLAATAGALLGAIFVVYPSMGDLATLKAFAVVIMGGMGNFLGAIVGGFILGIAESLGAGFISSGYKDAIGFIIIILVLMLKPEGLFGKTR